MNLGEALLSGSKWVSIAAKAREEERARAVLEERLSQESLGSDFSEFGGEEC
jgi:hypothetical protein